MMTTGSHRLPVALLSEAPPDFANTPDAPGAGAIYVEINADLTGPINQFAIAVPPASGVSGITCWMTKA